MKIKNGKLPQKELSIQPGKKSTILTSSIFLNLISQDTEFMKKDTQMDGSRNLQSRPSNDKAWSDKDWEDAVWGAGAWGQ